MLAERYGKNTYIKVWQLDNEYGCHDTTLSYSKSAAIAFKDWLFAKYKSIDVLNEAWGNVFWSMEYNNFEQIDLPYLMVTNANPSHELDFKRFSSDQVINFNHSQASLMRIYTDKPLIQDRKSTRLNSSHVLISYALFCLKKKTKNTEHS